MSILHLLRSDAHLNVNKSLARQIGLNAAIMYGEILSKWNYFKTRDDLTDDGFFYNTVEDMQHDTTLGRKQQQDAVKALVELNLIEYKVAGMPAKRFFKVNEDEEVIMSLLRKRAVDQFSDNLQTSSPDQYAENLRTGSQKSDEQVRRKSALNNNNSNNTKDKNNGKHSGASSPISKTLFDMPSDPTKDMDRGEFMLHQIAEARGGRVDWNDIKPAYFTHYFIERHNEIMPNKISFVPGRDSNKLKRGLIERFELPNHLVCDVIDELLTSFKGHPKNSKGLLSLTAIEENFFPDIFEACVRKVRPVERKYRTRTGQNVDSDRQRMTDVIF